jgi:8-oxo-dGTP diphosphatase
MVDGDLEPLRGQRWFSSGIGRYVAGAVVLRAGRVLILRRRPEDFRGGTWELPSGRIEPGEDLAAALAREVAEETGLAVLATGAVVGTFDYASRSGRRTRQVNVVVAVEDGPVTTTEHDAHRWVGVADLPDSGLSEQSRAVAEAALRRPASPIGPPAGPADPPGAPAGGDQGGVDQGGPAR